jgi:hypothetical protein
VKLHLLLIEFSFLNAASGSHCYFDKDADLKLVPIPAIAASHKRNEHFLIAKFQAVLEREQISKTILRGAISSNLSSFFNDLFLFHNRRAETKANFLKKR